jgi:hypothetical protein
MSVSSQPNNTAWYLDSGATQHICKNINIFDNYSELKIQKEVKIGDRKPLKAIGVGFDWKKGMSLPNPHYYSKLKGDAIYTSACLLNLNQCVETAGSGNLLDLIFSNLSDLDITPVYPGLIKPDNYHPPLAINIQLPFATDVQNYVYSYHKHSSGDYALLYNLLSNFDWSCVYGTTSVASLNAAVQDAMEYAIPCGCGIINTKFEIPALVF